MLITLLLLACGAPTPPAAPTQPAPAGGPRAEAGTPVAYRMASVKDLKAGLDGGKVPVLVDVRLPVEYAKGHVPGAVNIPVQDLDQRLGDLQSYKDQDVWLICRSGARSARAAELLTRKGYHAVDVDGGTDAWIAAGYQVDL